MAQELFQDLGTKLLEQKMPPFGSFIGIYKGFRV